jgi:hypothetical protein
MLLSHTYNVIELCSIYSRCLQWWLSNSYRGTSVLLFWGSNCRSQDICALTHCIVHLRQVLTIYSRLSNHIIFYGGSDVLFSLKTTNRCSRWSHFPLLICNVIDYLDVFVSAFLSQDRKWKVKEFLYFTQSVNFH